MSEYLPTIITAIATIIVAVIGAKTSKAQAEQKKYNERCEARAKLRERESRLSMSMMHSTMQLSIASANALLNKENNGNVEIAYSNAKKAEADYEAFLMDCAAHEVGK